MRIIDILSENDGTPPTDVDKHGNKFWRNAAGILHREDGPAVIFADSGERWWINGKRHRTDGPALIDPDGTQEWYRDGKLHREDGPAMIYPNVEQRWYRNGQLHREDGPAIIYPDGYQGWYQDGMHHREDGPAIVYPDGEQRWFRNGELHREDGPAVTHPDGDQEWYYDGIAHSPLIPMLLAAGATRPWHAQPEVVAKLNIPEEKKNIMRWLTRTARAGGDVDAAINALRKIGVRWPELETMAANAEDRAARMDESDYDDGSHTEINDKGAKIWKNARGLPHREDGPAIIFADGTEAWYLNGKQHRENGPAYVNPNGYTAWCINGKLHRIDGPAIMAPDGGQKWWFDSDQVGPVIPIILAAGWNGLLHPQPEVVAKLDTPEQKKNIMRWLTRTARAGGNVDTAIDALRTIGIDWSELTAFSGNTVSERSTITNANVNETERMQDIRAILDQIQVMRR